MSVFSKIIDRIVPKQLNFFELLAEQSVMVTTTMQDLDNYMNCMERTLARQLKKDEHAADRLKIRNLHELNRAFSTPIDRENIYRAIESMDRIVTHIRGTVNEMKVLGVEADRHMQRITLELVKGTAALQSGFECLANKPADVEQMAHRARHSHRRIERYYRKALADLFTGNDPVYMMKHREIYHHLMDGSRHLHSSANVLHDIMVQMV